MPQRTDSNGLTSLSTLDVTVNAVPPTVSAGTNLIVTAGQLTQFAGSASVPSGANDPLSYAWDFNYYGGAKDSHQPEAPARAALAGAGEGASRLALAVNTLIAHYPTSCSSESGESVGQHLPR